MGTTKKIENSPGPAFTLHTLLYMMGGGNVLTKMDPCFHGIVCHGNVSVFENVWFLHNITWWVFGQSQQGLKFGYFVTICSVLSWSCIEWFFLYINFNRWRRRICNGLLNGSGFIFRHMLFSVNQDRTFII